MLAGAISLDPTVNIQSWAESLVRRATRSPMEKYRSLFHTEQVVIYVIERPNERPVVPRWSTDDDAYTSGQTSISGHHANIHTARRERGRGQLLLLGNP